jgi:hypothetical protein
MQLITFALGIISILQFVDADVMSPGPNCGAWSAYCQCIDKDQNHICTVHQYTNENCSGCGKCHHVVCSI